jgi:hypothetical protein
LLLALSIHHPNLCRAKKTKPPKLRTWLPHTAGKMLLVDALSGAAGGALR